MRAFLAVAEAGSLSAAARATGIGQPTLGRQIRALEAELGAELFHRRARGLEPTDTGQALIEPAVAMRDAMTRIALTAAGQAARLEGTVRVTASVAMSVHHLPAILAGIRRAEPRIALELVPSDDTRNLLYREADIAVRMYRPTQLDLVARHLGDLTLGVFAARTYLDRRGRPRTPEDLLAHEVIGFDRSTLLIDGFAAAGYPVARDFFGLRCDDPATYWALVRAGAGIGFLQASVGRADPTLEEVDVGLDLPVLPVWLTAHAAIRRTPRIRRVWDMLAEGLAPVIGPPA